MAVSKRSIKVAACQMTVSADVEANYAAIREGIAQAAAKGAALVTFPECALSGYPPLHCSNRDQIDMEHINSRSQDVATLASEFAIGVVLGTITEWQGTLYNTALLFDETGQQVGYYNKMHLFPGDAEYFYAGDELPVFELAGAKIGLQICYDARFPEPFRYLKQQGAEVVVIISNACGSETWKLPVLEGVYRARASENGFYVVSVNATGPLQRAVSRICDVEGISLEAASRDKDQVIIADLDLNKVNDEYFSGLRRDIFKLETSFDQ